MKIQILSDLHFENYPDRGRFVNSSLPVGAENLIIAGDYCPIENISERIIELKDKFKNIFYLLGNHEFHFITRSEIRTTLLTLEKEVENFHWLRSGKIYYLDSSTRIFGDTLWFENSEYTFSRLDKTFDGKSIIEFRKWVFNENEKTKHFLNEVTTQNDVVVTHYSPFPTDNPFFYTDMRELISKAKPKLWIHGHIHESFDFKYKSTKIICNPFGYLQIKVNPNFSHRKVVTI